MFEIEVADRPSGKTCGQAKGDDPSRRSARNEVKVSSDASSAQKALLNSCQDGSREDAFDAATINAEDAEVAIPRPRKRLPALGERAGGPLGGDGLDGV